VSYVDTLVLHAKWKVALISTTAIKLSPHGDMGMPSTRIDSNEACSDWWVDGVVLNAVYVTVTLESLHSLAGVTVSRLVQIPMCAVNTVVQIVCGNPLVDIMSGLCSDLRDLLHATKINLEVLVVVVLSG